MFRERNFLLKASAFAGNAGICRERRHPACIGALACFQLSEHRGCSRLRRSLQAGCLRFQLNTLCSACDERLSYIL